MRKVVSLMGAVLGFAIVQSASAADLPTKAPLMAPAAPVSWTGFYVGVHAGAGWSHIESSFPGSGFVFSSHDLTGAFAGAQVGYNWQMGWAVWGLELNGSGSNIKGTGTCTFGNCTTKQDWLANATIRFGGLVNNSTLVYVKGGAAWSKDKYSSSIITTPVGDTRTGWLGGFGTEYKFDPRWSGLIEYNYADYGTDTVTVGIPVNIKHIDHTVRFGLNYKLF